MFARDDASIAHERWALISLDQSRATIWYVRGRNVSLETYIKLIPRLSVLEPVERKEEERVVDSLLNFDEACDLGSLIGEIQPDRDLHIVPYEGCRELLVCLQRGRSYELLKAEDGLTICGVDFSPVLASAMLSRMEVDRRSDINTTNTTSDSKSTREKNRLW